MLRNVFAVTAAAAVLAAGAAGAGAVGGTDIERVVCRGATGLTEGDLYHWLRTNLPASMVAVDPTAMRRQLLDRFPLDDVQVERRWPDTLVIRVEERKPYATVLAGDGRVAVVARDGRLASLRQDQGVALWDRPILRGCRLIADAHSTTDCIQRGVGFLSWLDLTEGNWLDDLSEVHVDQDSITVFLMNGLKVAFGTPPYGAKLKALKYGWAVAQRNEVRSTGIVLSKSGNVIFSINEGGTEPGPRDASEGRSDEA